MVPVQIWALTSTGIDPTLATRIAFGTSLAVILPTSLSGCRGHSCRGTVLWRPGILMGLFGLAGAFLGGTLAAHAPGHLLRMIFGFVVLLGALRMLAAAVTNREKDVLHELSDDEVREVAGKEVKKRTESLTIFEQAGRQDLADKERAEREVLSAYAPAQLDESAVDA